jgi:hypothetical protein
VNERLLRLLLIGWLGVFAAAAAVLLFPALGKLSVSVAGLAQVALGFAALGLGGGYLKRSPLSDVGDRTVRFDDFKPWP